jgi:hypothetical protein
MIPPSYIRARPVLGPSCEGQKPPAASGRVKFAGLPRPKRQIKKPMIIQVNGAIQEIALLFFFGCTELMLFVAAAVAVGLVSAMMQLIF